MPELPEVESVRRSLLPHVLGRRVRSCELLRRDVLVAPGDPVGGFGRVGLRPRPAPAEVSDHDLLVGGTITDVLRHGKQLALIAQDPGSSDSFVLGVQLGMTGHLHATDSPALGPHTHARWTLHSGGYILFDDPRRFGGLRVFRSLADLRRHWATLGPDALEISGLQLADAVRGSARTIKAALLDQGVLAGVGNIYADEALFLAGIRPTTRCRRLTIGDCDRVAERIRTVLAAAVNAGGSTLRDYVDANGQPGRYQDDHLVYGRGGQPCVRCRSTLKERSVAQRTTVWCPACQR